MKKTDADFKNTPYRHFGRLRIMAFIVIICTLAVTAVIIKESLTSNEESAKGTLAVSSAIKKLFNITDKEEENLNPPNEISLSLSYKTPYLYYGTKSKLSVSVLPAFASNKVEFSCDKEGILIEENGELTVTTPYYSAIQVTATSKLAPQKKATITLYALGVSPNGEMVEEQRINFDGNYSVGKGEIAELYLGKGYLITTQAILKESFRSQLNLDDGYVNSQSPLRLTWLGEGEAPFIFNSNTKVLTFNREARGKVKFTFLSESGSDEGVKSLTLDVNCIPHPTEIYAPSSPPKLSLATPHGSLTENDDGSYDFLWEPDTSSGTFFDLTLNEGTNTDYYLEGLGEAKKYVNILTNILLCRACRGQFGVKLVPVAAPDEYVVIHTTIKDNSPTQMFIANEDDFFLVESSSKLKISYNTEVYGEGAVRWSIVKGQSIASISEDGILTTKFFGKITLRAESVNFPELYHERTFNVVLFDNLYSFTRKILGHFLGFAVLGLGFFAFYTLFLRPRAHALWAAPLTVLGIATLSEIFQLPAFTSGRTARVVDVFTDLAGGLTGIIFGLILLSLILFIWRLISKKSFKDLIQSADKLTLKTLFKRKNDL